MKLEEALEEARRLIEARIKTGHDGFARETVTGKKVLAKKGGCDWCGSTPKSGKLIKYSVQSDQLMAQPNPIKGEFCGIDCANSYHS